MPIKEHFLRRESLNSCGNLGFFSRHGNLAEQWRMVRCLPTMRETRVWSLGWEDPLKKEMATHSSTLAWKIPWTEERGRLQSMGSQRVRHHWATSLGLGLGVNLLIFWNLLVTTAYLTLTNTEWNTVSWSILQTWSNSLEGNLSIYNFL